MSTRAIKVAPKWQLHLPALIVELSYLTPRPALWIFGYPWFCPTYSDHPLHVESDFVDDLLLNDEARQPLP
ncbi:hypothetical protein M8C21_012547 [Ambrosia artemisiifolia]|uniref:Uncharacterized protein n=1 Tax=Ambrosia artemisiifolia TaxID=4212 RepID=A0AAD5GAW6_AMBAR|nr:hypothetical protein M8C21_012547 [Ambrosia artemisiifolia]